MRKSLVVLCFVLMSLSLVVANEMVVSIGGITSPLDVEYVGEEVLIEWENGNFVVAILKYNPGLCDQFGAVTLDENIDSTGEYLWDLSDLDDGDYCIKILDLEQTYYSVEVKKDTTAPVIEFSDTPYFGDTLTDVNIKVNVVDNGDIEEWTLDFGDDSDVVTGDVGLIEVSHGYAEGSYVVTLTVVDEMGNKAEDSVSVFVSDEVFDFEIGVLADEMNVFSIPLVTDSSDIEDVLGEEVSSRAEKIWSYQQGAWKYNTPSGSGWSSATSRLQEIVPGYGYIIFMEEDSIIRGKGSDVVSKMPSQGIEMVPGWNLIGLRGLGKDIHASEVLSSVNFGDSYSTDKVVFFNGDAWVDTEMMDSEVGYWVSVLSDDEIVYL